MNVFDLLNGLVNGCDFQCASFIHASAEKQIPSPRQYLEIAPSQTEPLPRLLPAFEIGSLIQVLMLVILQRRTRGEISTFMLESIWSDVKLS